MALTLPESRSPKRRQTSRPGLPAADATSTRSRIDLAERQHAGHRGHGDHGKPRGKQLHALARRGPQPHHDVVRDLAAEARSTESTVDRMADTSGRKRARTGPRHQFLGRRLLDLLAGRPPRFRANEAEVDRKQADGQRRHPAAHGGVRATSRCGSRAAGDELDRDDRPADRHGIALGVKEIPSPTLNLDIGTPQGFAPRPRARSQQQREHAEPDDDGDPLHESVTASASRPPSTCRRPPQPRRRDRERRADVGDRAHNLAEGADLRRSPEDRPRQQHEDDELLYAGAVAGGKVGECRRPRRQSTAANANPAMHRASA